MQSQGLFDLQVNGYAGIDFNDADITAADVDEALEAMRKSGVTGCLPTLITASADELEQRFIALDTAVSNSRLGASMVPGYHLEGPFLNDSPGYCGCHPGEAMCDPEVAMVNRLEDGLERPILLITLAPERSGALSAALRLCTDGKALAIGHSAADFDTIAAACEAGVSMSTHLGNGLPQKLPKLDNTLLAQLAERRLSACLIADGHHISPAALRALVTLKGIDHCALVTDAVLAAAAPAGTYRFAGMEVSSHSDGAVRLPGSRSLAGSSLCLDKAVRNVCAWSIGSPEQAVKMASGQPRAMLAKALEHHGIKLDAGKLSWSSTLEPSIVRDGEIAR